MLSAIVFCGDEYASRLSRRGTKEDDFDIAQAMVSTLTGLVPAHVDGLLRDMIIIGPAGHDLALIADHAGCGLVEAETEAEGFAAAIAMARGPGLFLLKAGFRLETGFIEECRRHLRQGDDPLPLCIKGRRPETLFERLWPTRRPLAGLILPRGNGTMRPGETFASLSQRYRKEKPLRCRAFEV
ncbi:hypothetical protein [Beijerinckia indica]|uniref:Uncharacterized protein n=1 Tax=Beijerinckia indica subsp. indica (strain ATCC 9039 / DSM 1715 / NCIMB 8712) TaxID=395963 RepID=B2IHB0_BEII9|nr:hypothetical protein [Beijerinckia indica]ACB95895.1 hypothetical protein Bind_2279 [Beijerinckia indica subsp. indica ATCC 9039]